MLMMCLGFAREFEYRKILLLLLTMGGFFPAGAQYYYQDIYRTQETNRQHREYRLARIKEIRIKSFDARNTPNKGFQCKKNFSNDYRTTITRTRSFSTGTDNLVSFFDEKGRVIHTRDSSAESVSHTWIYYGPEGEIDSLVFLSYAPERQRKDSLLTHPGADYRLRETHIYQYDTSHTLIKMIRTKNNRTYATIYFTTDSAGHIFKEFEKNNDRPAYYYRYNENGQLSDLFHYSSTQKKMIPDYLFNYDQEGRLVQKTVVMTNSRDYLEWHYSYDNKGHIKREECYNNKRELQGSLVFEYDYQP